MFPSSAVTAPLVSILPSVLSNDTFCFAVTAAFAPVVIVFAAVAVTSPSVEVATPSTITLPASAFSVTFLAFASDFSPTVTFAASEVRVIAPFNADNLLLAVTLPWALATILPATAVTVSLAVIFPALLFNDTLFFA